VATPARVPAPCPVVAAEAQQHRPGIAFRSRRTRTPADKRHFLSSDKSRRCSADRGGSPPRDPLPLAMAFFERISSSLSRRGMAASMAPWFLPRSAGRTSSARRCSRADNGQMDRPLTSSSGSPQRAARAGVCVMVARLMPCGCSCTRSSTTSPTSCGRWRCCVVRHGRYVIFQLAEVAVPRRVVGVGERLPDITGQMRPERSAAPISVRYRLRASDHPVSVIGDRARVERRQDRGVSFSTSTTGHLAYVGSMSQDTTWADFARCFHWPLRWGHCQDASPGNGRRSPRSTPIRLFRYPRFQVRRRWFQAPERGWRLMSSMALPERRSITERYLRNRPLPTFTGIATIRIPATACTSSV
jgi:hypothetical protein